MRAIIVAIATSHLQTYVAFAIGLSCLCCRWEQLKDQALQQPLRDSPAAYRAIREMLAKGTSDPYTRFITPEEFESMRKYDVTGVGLHLGTAEEFVRKTGLRLPPGHDESEVSARTRLSLGLTLCTITA